MADTSRIIASGLLGLVGGGVQGYQQAKQMQKEYAMKKLAEKPESQKTFEWLQNLPPEQAKPAEQFAYNLGSVKSPYVTSIPNPVLGGIPPPGGAPSVPSGPYIPGASPVRKISIKEPPPKVETGDERYIRLTNQAAKNARSLSRGDASWLATEDIKRNKGAEFQ